MFALSADNQQIQHTFNGLNILSYIQEYRQIILHIRSQNKEEKHSSINEQPIYKFSQ